MRSHPNRSNIYDINVIIVRRTDRAVLVEGALRDTGEPVWVPLSLIELSDNGDETTHKLSAPEWLLVDKGLL